MNSQKMENVFRELLGLLKEIISNYSKLESVLKQERESIINNSLDSLLECIKKRETISLKLRILEESREGFIKRLSKEFKVSSEEINLTFLSSHVEALYRVEFNKIKSTLIPLIQNIKRLNTGNRHFIEQSIEGVKSSFRFIGDITNTKRTYISSGSLRSASMTSGKFISQQA